VRTIFRLSLLSFVASVLSCSPRTASNPSPAQNASNLNLSVASEFRFVVLGDTRFHDATDTKTANPEVRQAMVEVTASEKPSFITISGDIVNAGDSQNDWAVWDSETAVWRRQNIPVYPALGNHDLKGGEGALSNYFSRFPQLNNNRYYSVRFGNCLMLVLDSSIDETSGPQGEWLQNELRSLPDSVDFLFVALHHPPYTNSSASKELGGGHSARSSEQALAALLETRRPSMHQQIIVLTGHVHNYERYEHGGVSYFVTGGGGAHPYLVPRKSSDVYQDTGVNYHYLLIEVSPNQIIVTMNKLEIVQGKQAWSKPDRVTIPVRGASDP